MNILNYLFDNQQQQDPIHCNALQSLWTSSIFFSQWDIFKHWNPVLIVCKTVVNRSKMSFSMISFAKWPIKCYVTKNWEDSEIISWLGRPGDICQSDNLPQTNKFGVYCMCISNFHIVDIFIHLVKSVKYNILCELRGSLSNIKVLNKSYIKSNSLYFQQINWTHHSCKLQFPPSVWEFSCPRSWFAFDIPPAAASSSETGQRQSTGCHNRYGIK